VFDQNGVLVDNFERNLEMKLKEETLASPTAAGVEVKALFNLKPGKYTLRLVLRDSEGQMMASRDRAVDVP
jgi:hypothetical protein